MLVEHWFMQIKHTPQHLIRVLQIVVDGGCDPAVRQAASIHFKNFIAKHWDPHSGNFNRFWVSWNKRNLLVIPCFCCAGDQSKILPSDKNVVRDQILVYVSQLPPILRYQLLYTLQHSCAQFFQVYLCLLVLIIACYWCVCDAEFKWESVWRHWFTLTILSNGPISWTGWSITCKINKFMEPCLCCGLCLQNTS